MRSRNSLLFFVSSILLLFTTLCTAWPWPIDHMLVRRQDSTASGSSSSVTATQTGSSSSKPTQTGSSSGSTGTITGSPTTGTNSGSSSTGTDSSDPATTDYDARLPAGGVSMITPAPLSGAQYYKIGDYITFAWNYTSLSSTPTAIDVVASCATNQQTYPIATNATVQPTGNFTWDTKPFASANTPLVMASYTLLIYDAAKGPSATAKSGYLAVQNSFVFGMYIPEQPTPLNAFYCATCSAGTSLSATEWQVVKLALGMSTLTVLSFTWFVRGLGIFV